MRQHEADYGTEAHVLLDPHHRLVDLTHARVTPEGAVVWFRSSRVRNLFASFITVALTIATYRLGNSGPKPPSSI